MKLITVSVDESIIDQLMEKLKEFPEDKIKINDEPILEDLTLDDVFEIDEDEDDDLDDYFMVDDDEEVMPFEIEINNDDEFGSDDGTAEVHIYFKNGSHYFGYYIPLDEVSTYIEEDEYYFSGFVVVKTIDPETVRNSILDMIERRDFFEAFDDAEDFDPDSDNSDLGLDGIDPVRRN